MKLNIIVGAVLTLK